MASDGLAGLEIFVFNGFGFSEDSFGEGNFVDGGVCFDKTAHAIDGPEEINGCGPAGSEVLAGLECGMADVLLLVGGVAGGDPDAIACGYANGWGSPDSKALDGVPHGGDVWNFENFFFCGEERLIEEVNFVVLMPNSFDLKWIGCENGSHGCKSG